MDWRDPSSWECGGNRGDPFAETVAAAGGPLSLQEALFVKAKEGTVQTSSSLMQMAANYERRMEEQVDLYSRIIHTALSDLTCCRGGQIVL